MVTAPTKIDIATVGRFRLSLAEAAGPGHGIVVVDMTRSTFCDCAGLTTLIRAHKQALAAGGELRLLLPADGIVRRLFSVSGVGQALPTFGSLRAALGDGAGAPGSGGENREPCGPWRQPTCDQ